MIWIIILISASFIFVAFNRAYKCTNRYKNAYSDIYTIKKIESSEGNYDIINIGSSQAKYAYDYASAEIKGANLAARPQTLQIDSFLCENTINKIKPNGYVIISVCLLEFFLFRFKDDQDYDKYIQVLTTHQFKQIENKSILKAYVKDLTPLLFSPFEIRFIFHDIKPKKVLDIDFNSCGSQKNINEDAMNWISLWNKEFNINIPDIKIPDSVQYNIEANIKILQQMVDMCIASSIKPIFVIPPVTDILLSKFNDQFINKYLISILTTRIRGNVLVLNYLGNEDMKDESLYMNSFFLNKIGRAKFTNMLVSHIKSTLI